MLYRPRTSPSYCDSVLSIVILALFEFRQKPEDFRHSRDWAPLQFRHRTTFNYCPPGGFECVMRLLPGVEADGCCSGCGDYLLSDIVEGDFNCDLCRSLFGPDSGKDFVSTREPGRPSLGPQEAVTSRLSALAILLLRCLLL